jgi:hypothetical protein
VLKVPSIEAEWQRGVGAIGDVASTNADGVHATNLVHQISFSHDT